MLCRIMIEHLTGEREQIWESADPNYFQLLDGAADELRQRIADQMYVVEIFSADSGIWQVSAYRF
jgi:hypothetical protein